MRYYRAPTSDGDRLVARPGDRWYDLTAVRPELETFGDLVAAAAVVGGGIDAITDGLTDDAPEIDPAAIDVPGRPVIPDEVWAAGVTYAISEEARESESAMPELYLDVYGAERPELFFKATPGRTVGPGEAVGIRGDSDWNVPEPELGVVLYRGEIVGFTAGNDASSRSIEGENPLYLPQAKVYDRCCAIGPCVATPATVGDPHDLDIEMAIERDGDGVFEGATSTGEMVRSVEELVAAYRRHNHVPRLTVLLTGTSIVPPDEFTLRAGDRVRITIEGLGTLENEVTVV